MGTNMSKQQSDGLTPAKLVIMTHPSNKRKIQKCMTKWHKMTSGKNRWPKEGSFDPSCCEEVEERLRNKDKKRDRMLLHKKQRHAEQRDILQYFKVEHQKSPTAPEYIDHKPPPYHPSAAGQYPVVIKSGSKGKITGQLKLVLEEEEEEREKEMSSTRQGEYDYSGDYDGWDKTQEVRRKAPHSRSLPPVRRRHSPYQRGPHATQSPGPSHL